MYHASILWHKKRKDSSRNSVVAIRRICNVDVRLGACPYFGSANPFNDLNIYIMKTIIKAFVSWLMKPKKQHNPKDDLGYYDRYTAISKFPREC